MSKLNKRDKLKDSIDEAQGIITHGDTEIVDLIKGDQEVYVPQPPEPPPASASSAEDFEKIRETSFELIDIGRDALMDLASVAKTSEHPRAYEVLSTLMKTISEVGRDLMEMHDRMQNIPKGKDRDKVTTQTTINNGDTNIIQVNPAHLLDLVIEKEKRNA